MSSPRLVPLPPLQPPSSSQPLPLSISWGRGTLFFGCLPFGLGGQSYFFLSLHAHVCELYAHLCIHLPMCGQGHMPKVDARCLLLHSLLLGCARSFSEPKACQCLARPSLSPGTPFVSTSRVLIPSGHHACPTFTSVDSEEPNARLQTCTASALPTEPSSRTSPPQLLGLVRVSYKSLGEGLLQMHRPSMNGYSIEGFVFPSLTSLPIDTQRGVGLHEPFLPNQH